MTPNREYTEHRRGYVDAEHVPGRADQVRELEQRLTTPAPHVEDALARDDSQALHRDAPQRIDDDVRALLHAHPRVPGSFDEGLTRAGGIGRAHDPGRSIPCSRPAPTPACYKRAVPMSTRAALISKMSIIGIRRRGEGLPR